jgi:hypothetical protein
VAVACVPLFFVRTIRRRDSFPTQPGHWILLIRGLTTLMWLAGWSGRVAIQDFWTEPGRSYLAMQYVPASLTALVGYAVASRYGSNEARLWRLTLRLMLLNAVLGLVVALAVMIALDPSADFRIPYSCNSCLNQVIGVIIISAVISDPQRPSRDFLHWAGVASYLAGIGLPWLYSALVYALRT